MTGQNRSTAVMQRRRVAPESLEYFPTPPFATRALCEFLMTEIGEPLDVQTAWEPACGELHMARALSERFDNVRVSDCHRYGDDHELLDFLLFGAGEPEVDWVITNPPFRLARPFIETALTVARRGVAMLVRSAYLESESRMALFTGNPPAYVLQFCERVVMLEGRLVRRGAADPFNLDADGAPMKASTATSYCWLIWMPGHHDTRLRWIPPSIDRLERPGDYPAYPMPVADDGGLFAEVNA